MAYQPTIGERRAAAAAVFLCDAYEVGGNLIAFTRKYAAESGQGLDRYTDEQVGLAVAYAIRRVALEDRLDALGQRVLALERSGGGR